MYLRKGRSYDLSLKLGGIPCFEDYYHHLIENYPEKELLSDFYNPLTPGEDIYQIYTWGICSSGNNSEGKNITQLVGHNNYTFYHRQLKELENIED